MYRFLCWHHNSTGGYPEYSTNWINFSQAFPQIQIDISQIYPTYYPVWKIEIQIKTNANKYISYLYIYIYTFMFYIQC